MDKEKDKKGKTNQGVSNKKKMVSFLECIPKKKVQKPSTVFCARNMGHAQHSQHDGLS